MYVVIDEVKIDPDRMTEVRQFLNDVIAPRAQEFAGFKAGYWLRSSDGDAGRSLLFFESEDAARCRRKRDPDLWGTGRDARHDGRP